MMLKTLDDVLRSAGLNVVEVDGWRDRGHGEMSSVDGVTCHHTASGRGTGTTLGLSTVVQGRPRLDGPLAHLYLNRAGTFYVVAAGLCYHAGVSRKNTYTNPHRIGIEALAAGDGWNQDWPEAQLTAYARGCAALAHAYRFDVDEVLGHKETCEPVGRKVDPFGFSMSSFRGMVRAVDLRKPFGVQEETVDKADAKLVAAEVWGRQETLTAAAADALGGSAKAGDLVGMDTLLQFAPAVARLRREQGADNQARTDQIAKLKMQADRIELEQIAQRELLEKVLTAVTTQPPEA
jgi:N-acetylmuramoyl-L-alanine amidase-like protein